MPPAFECIFAFWTFWVTLVTHLLFAFQSKMRNFAVTGPQAQQPHSGQCHPPVSPELCPRSLCRTPVWAGDAWARQAANDYCSCYFKPLVYNQNVFLPKIQSRSAARLLILTQVPPVSQVWSSLQT